MKKKSSVPTAILAAIDLGGQDRNLYVTEVWNGRTQKLRPKPNADPGKIVGPPVDGWPPQ